MFQEPDWRPDCLVSTLADRARLLATIREFFTRRGVLEVETPVLSRYRGTDPNLATFRTEPDAIGQCWYLQTSPEFAMKRLLAAGSGSIYQIGKAFRQDEAGRYHNPEFTLLEWYRPDFDLPALMTETEQLLFTVDSEGRLPTSARRFSYRALFRQRLELDPWQFDRGAYVEIARQNGLNDAERICGDEHGLWLDLLFSQLIQPDLGQDALTWVYHFPIWQSSLARVCADDSNAVERAELFINGIELANGYHELTDADQQKQRFDQENHWRKKHGLAEIMPDPRLLAALAFGLPDCSGIALGLDRLLMLLTGADSLNRMLTFSIARA